MNSCTPLGAAFACVWVWLLLGPVLCSLIQAASAHSNGLHNEHVGRRTPCGGAQQQLGVRVYDGPTACSTEETVIPGKRLGMHYTGTIDAVKDRDAKDDV